MVKIERELLHLAGEYRVCSELLKRGVFATVTYGNRKAVDVYAIGDRRKRAIKIEVKTSQQSNFVTGITQKGLYDDPNAPDFWVLCQMKQGNDGAWRERFFVLSHKKICKAQADRNRKYARHYRAKHRRDPDPSTGVDNVRIEDVERYEDAWEELRRRLGVMACSGAEGRPATSTHRGVAAGPNRT